MTWLDITFIIIWLIFIAVGARLGSLWTGSCVLGGFLGSFLADIYAHPMSEFIGGFPGSAAVSALLLFLVGLVVVLLPGWLLSRVGSVLFLGVVDSAFGLLTGALVGLVAIGLVLLLLVPFVPRVEKGKAWKKSMLVKPYHSLLEDLFVHSRWDARRLKKKLQVKKAKKMVNKSGRALKEWKETAGDLMDELK